MSEHKDGELVRGLSGRHIQLIALGGAIGVGLFLGSSYAIKMAGPAIILSYLIAAITVFFVMRCLGEIAVEHPIHGGFAHYARRYLSHRAGFITAWMYWAVWITAGMALLSAVGVYLSFWFPTLPQWVPVSFSVIFLGIINLAPVKNFGEFEFWFAIIKVITLVAMIAFGLYLVVAGTDAPGFSNLYALEGGFMPHGMYGVMSAMTVAVFAFLGLELIGITAAETKDPVKTIPSSIRKVVYGVVILYVGALVVIMSLWPWAEIGTKGSPFVLVFEGVGITAAASILNFVVVTAALSSFNSGIYATSRLMYSLSMEGNAPKAFGKLSKGGVPYVAVLTIVAIMGFCVLMNYVAPDAVFQLFVSACTFFGVFVWMTVVVTHIGWRRKLTPAEVANLKYPSLLYPIGNYVALGLLGFVMVMLAVNPDLRDAYIMGPAFLVFLYIVHRVKYKND